MSMGKLAVRLPLQNSSMLAFCADVVRADIPVFLGLDVMSRCGLVLEMIEGELGSEQPPWRMPIVYHFGHELIMKPGTLRGLREEMSQGPTDQHSHLGPLPSKPLHTLLTGRAYKTPPAVLLKTGETHNGYV